MAKKSVTIGVQFTAPLPVKLEDAVLDELLTALPNGGWHDVKIDDGTLRVNLAQVTYIKTDDDERGIGFG